VDRIHDTEPRERWAHETELSRRGFLALGGGCAAHLLLSAAARSPGERPLFARTAGSRITSQEPWGRIEQVAEDAWALISTPLSGGENAMRTVSNGGIIAGRSGVLLVEGLGSPEGAAWMTEQTRELTGRDPTHVVLTHYHGDHSRGIARQLEDITEVELFTTETTRARFAGSDRTVAVFEALSGPNARLVEQDPVEIDLGGRRVRVTPRLGHTGSDLTVELFDPPVVWCGDLVWNEMFPNYVDAIPSELSAAVRAVAGLPGPFVPGHGPMADAARMGEFVTLIDDVEEHARAAIDAGIPVSEAAAAYRPPGALGEWVRFSDRYYEVAFSAWERELGG